MLLLNLELYIAQNKLRKIEGLEGLSKLRILDLGANRIRVRKHSNFWFSFFHYLSFSSTYTYTCTFLSLSPSLCLSKSISLSLCMSFSLFFLFPSISLSHSRIWRVLSPSLRWNLFGWEKTKLKLSREVRIVNLFKSNRHHYHYYCRFNARLFIRFLILSYFMTFLFFWNDSGVGQFSHLRQLDIQNNRLTSLGSELISLPSLCELYLACNAISTVEGLPPGSPLSTLDLSNNPLVSLEGIQQVSACLSICVSVYLSVSLSVCLSLSLCTFVCVC